MGACIECQTNQIPCEFWEGGPGVEKSWSFSELGTPNLTHLEYGDFGVEWEVGWAIEYGVAPQTRDVRLRLRAQAFATHPLGNGWLQLDQDLPYQVTLTTGRCDSGYTVVTIPTPEELLEEFQAKYPGTNFTGEVKLQSLYVWSWAASTDYHGGTAHIKARQRLTSSRNGCGFLGDVDGDGKVTVGDIGVIASGANFGKTVEEAADQCADVNGDGFVNTYDLGIVANLVGRN